MRKYFMVLTFFCIFYIFCINCYTTVCAAENEKRVIHVVYDDSGSMVRNKEQGKFIYTSKWCQAKYAMEVFAAMMGQNDTMNIYPMSIRGKKGKTVKGTDKNRVKAIHDMNGLDGEYKDTPFVTVSSAAEDLKKEKECEKWLVVLTDGTFDEEKYKKEEEIYKKLLSYTADEIKVIYLTIGSDAKRIKDNIKKGIYTYKAETAEDILTQLTGIANQIFVNQELNEKFLKISQEKIKLDVDIPINKIMVFAQGKNVKVGDLILPNHKKVKATNIQNVKYSDVLPEKSSENIYPKESIKVEKNLCGMIAVYEAGSVPYESGEYEVSISDYSNVKVYIGAGVKAQTRLFRNGEIVSEDEKLYKGDYKIEFLFENPLTGEDIDSELLKDTSFIIKVNNNGKIQEFKDANATILVDEGNLVVTTEAELPDKGKLTSKKEYTIFPQPVELALSIKKPEQDYSVSSLGKEKADPMILSVINKQTGDRLSKEEWEASDLIITSKENINYTVERGEEISTWKIWPDYYENAEKTIQGNVDFKVAVDYHVDLVYGSGSIKENITIGKAQCFQLKMDIKNPYPYNKKYDFFVDEIGEKTNQYLLATVKVVNDKTGEERKLTQQEWEAGKFEIITKRSEKNDTLWLIRFLGFQSLEWKIEPGEQISTYKLIPQAGKWKTMILTGLLDLDIGYSYETEIQKGKGKKLIQIHIKPYPVSVYIGVMTCVSLFIFLLFFEVIGYAIKPKFPKNMIIQVSGHEIEFEGTRGNELPPIRTGKKIRYRWGPIWNPAKPQELTADFFYRNYLDGGCSLRMIAQRGKRIKIPYNDIMHMERLAENNLKISNKKWKKIINQKSDVYFSCYSSLHIISCDFSKYSVSKGKLYMIIRRKKRKRS